jgi:protein-S-isoprenylcysteine O-methyltransferase Ste14
LRIAVQAALLFGSFGGFAWPAAWLYLGLVLAFQSTLTAMLLRRNPELLNARARLQPGSRSWDLAILVAAFLLGYVALAAAGLETRRSGDASLSAGRVLVGIAGMASAFALILRAMIENPHFEGLVRIQTERGHAVCRSGPYAWIRHPGYAGMILGNLCIPLLLGSRWAAIPAGAAALLLVLRTALEDRTLQLELTGYLDYAAAVRSRLIPGVW